MQQMIIFIAVCTETRGAERRMQTQGGEASAYRRGTSHHTCPHALRHTHTLARTQSLFDTHTRYTSSSGVTFSPLPSPVVRQCDRNPCGRGATCQEAPGSYRCLCPPGWTGRTCQLGQWVRISRQTPPDGLLVGICLVYTVTVHTCLCLFQCKSE